MSLAQMVNTLLSSVNLMVMRRSSLERLLTELQAAQTALALPNEPQVTPALIAQLSEDTLNQLRDQRRELLQHQVAAKWEVVDFLMRTMAQELKSRSCPLCGYQDADEAFVTFETQCLFGGGHLLRHQCPSCDVIFGADKMFQLSSAELSQDYEWHYSMYEEGDSTEQELRAFHSLQPLREGTYLNYGAGAWSRSVQILREQGWNVLAFEPHGSASAAADYVISSRSVLSEMKFDGLFSNNVLEHFRQPVSELSFMRTLLKPGGQMAHATPCFEYRYEYTRFHLFFFLGRSRAYLADNIGVSIREFITDNDFMCCVMEPIEP
jgi:hypothetical protein